MIIIGEKINGTRKEVAEAIAAKDENKIRILARTQAEAGANYIDVNARNYTRHRAGDTGLVSKSDTG